MRSCLPKILLILCIFCFRLSAAPGPYIGPNQNYKGALPFSSRQNISCTYFFPWYDVLTGTDVTPKNTDSMTDHPPYATPSPINSFSDYGTRPRAVFHGPFSFSYRDVNWLKSEMVNIHAAGIDIALTFSGRYVDRPAFANANSEVDLQESNLNDAMDSLEKSGLPFPKVALFVGTDEIRHSEVDLASSTGKTYFYSIVRDFYSRIRPDRWVRLDNKVVVWLWVTDGLEDSTPFGNLAATFKYAKDNFAKDFGGSTLMFVGSPEWHARYNAPIDLTYSWDAGRHPDGLLLNDIAEIGPGYNHLGNLKKFASRENGDRYRRGWALARASGRHIIAIETWNEMYEATEVCPTYEYGTEYSDITARNNRDFHLGR